MRILLVASKYLPEYTGAALRLHTLYRSLRDETPGWRVQVVCGGVEHVDRADYALDGIAVHRVRSRAPGAGARLGRVVREWADAIETLRYLRGCPCDVVHTIGSSPVVAAAIHYARIRKLPFLVELVTPGAVPDQGLPVLGRAWRPDMHRGGAIVAISEPIAEACEARGYGRNLWARPNPVETERFYPDHGQRDNYRAQVSPFGPDDIVLTSVAKFMPRKNQIFLLDVLARLEGRFKLILAGPYSAQGALAGRDRDYFEAIQAKLASLGLAGRVHVVPEFVPADRYIKAGDIFLMPMLEEGFGTPVLEAQACGIPVIANSAVPAFKPHIKDGETGYLRPLDAGAWANAAVAALTLDRDALGRQAREIARRYSLAATRDAYRRILERLGTLNARDELDIGALLGRHGEPGSAPPDADIRCRAN